MKKVIRLSENDLSRLVRKIINETISSEKEKQILVDTDTIPCLKQNFRFQVYKITDRNVLSKFQGIGSSKPVLSNKNVIILDKSMNVSVVSNGNLIGTLSLANTKLGEELYIVKEVVYVAQNGDKFKFGWVMCNGHLYIYDILGETSIR